jgi:ADP-heptose:LPS heptosyltransferase
MRKLKLFFIFYFHKFSSRTPPASSKIAVVKMDAIGDYVLMRNFFTYLKQPGVELTLIGNSSYRELAESFDADLFSEFIWLQPERLSQEGTYRSDFFKRLGRSSFQMVLNPTYSRTFLSDLIVFKCHSLQKIGWDGDLENIHPCLKKISNRFYTELLTPKIKKQFEFFRNRSFFSQILKTPLDLEQPFFKGQLDKNRQHKVAIFLGASAKFRKWPVERYAQIAKILHSKFNLEPLLLGGPECLDEEEKFKAIYEGNFISLIGKTTLEELVQRASEVCLSLSNDSSFSHICVATKTPVFVISNGHHYGRFSPYPKVTSFYRAIYPQDFVEGDGAKIESITTDQVLQKVLAFFEEQINS